MGTPGAGKSTVLKEAMKDRRGWTAVNYGDLMFEQASKAGLVKSRDELRMLSIAKQHAIQSSVANALSKMKGNVILDTHCSINTSNGYYPGLPYPLLRKLKVDALVLITAPIEDIVGRRRSDTTRRRDMQSKAELAEHIRINEAMLASYSILTGAPVLIICNPDGYLDKAVERLESLLDHFEG